MATTNQPVLSDAQLAELEKLARAQERTVPEVVSEAVHRYIKEKQWSALKQYGRTKSRELGLTEADVPRLIAESVQNAPGKWSASPQTPMCTSPP
jgi:predicted transcriptional regulator